jgi:hypothetical protein
MPHHIANGDSATDPATLDAIRDWVRREVPALIAPAPLDPLYRYEGDMHERQDILRPGDLPRASRGLIGWIKSLVRQRLVGLLWGFFRRQVEYNSAVLGHAREAEQVLAALDCNVTQLAAAVVSLLREVTALREQARRDRDRLATLRADLNELRGRRDPTAPTSDVASMGLR